MECHRTARADVVRFVTGFELKHGRGPSTFEVADGHFEGKMLHAQRIVAALIQERQLRRVFPTDNCKLQALSPLPVPRSPFGEPLHFVRIGGAK